MKTDSPLNIPATRIRHPLQWVPSVYFAMGMPFVMLSLVSVIMLKDLGVANAKITFWTSLIILPWTLKPLWSPFLEMFRTKKYFVVGTQLITGLSFALLALSLPLPDFFTYAIALMGLIAFSGATHDIATDGIYMNELNASTQATYIGWQGAFFNIAKVVCNGGLVFLAGMLMKSIGTLYAWMVITGICAGVMIALSLYHSRMLPLGGAADKIKSFKDGWLSFTEVFATFFRKRYIWYYMAFIILYRLAEGLAIKVLPLFLKADFAEGGMGLTNENYGLIVGTLGTLAFILGSILAGHFVSKKGLRRTLFLLCCTINLPFLFYLLLAIYQPAQMTLTGTAIVCEYFGYGFGFVGLTLFMMQQVAPGKHKMAHYAFASGIMNLGYMLAGMVSGWISDSFGYELFFVIVAIAMIPALALSRIVPFTHSGE
ncbi:MAG: MFS transporter [Prevotellaceae bacterium]|jgi:PAT family beta-lactamase induction signal transducer AmpG|nr:MFS transporter [Prevotellaceae bacterium]